MGDFASEILKKYGTPAFIFAIVGAGVVWALAHFAAAPGGEATVLWGLVKYTKKAEIHDALLVSPNDTKINNSTESEVRARQKPTALPPLSLSIRHNVSNGNFSKVLLELREERNLRELSVSESGKKISEMPEGTFFFTLGAWLSSDTKWDGETRNYDFLTPFKRHETWRIRSSESYVEIHYPREQDYSLILFISEQTASQISQLDGVTGHKIMAAIYPWGQMTSLISLSVGRINKSERRDVQVTEKETRTVLDLVIR